ncbi:MAG: hypothetical protein Q9225_000177 [Loekoesia sp. 1 TL-2023]
MASNLADEDDDESLIPMQDQQVFGAGIWRKEIKFVSSTDSPDQPSASRTPTPGAGDRYLAIVLNKKGAVEDGNEKQSKQLFSAKTSRESEQSNPAFCKICRLPLSTDEARTNLKPHETSLTHQVCLEHSHPPSHLDRNSQGLKYLSSYGWDPDARRGLGATGSGIRIPVKAQPKNDTLGLGLLAPLPSNKVVKHPPKKLDAKQTRKGEVQAQKERQRLKDLFYQHEDVEKYLGSNG